MMVYRYRCQVLISFYILKLIYKEVAVHGIERLAVAEVDKAAIMAGPSSVHDRLGIESVRTDEVN